MSTQKRFADYQNASLNFQPDTSRYDSFFNATEFEPVLASSRFESSAITQMDATEFIQQPSTNIKGPNWHSADEMSTEIRSAGVGRQTGKLTKPTQGSRSPHLSSEFLHKIDTIGQRLKIPGEYLMAVMGFETGGTYSPKIQNKTSGATGLIQFLPSTARSLGTSTEQLSKMSAVQQLDYVERYFQPYAGKLRSLQDTYMAVFHPKSIGKPSDSVIARQGSKAFNWNKGLDTNQDGKITPAEATERVRKYLSEQRGEKLDQSSQTSHQPKVGEIPKTDPDGTISTAKNWGSLSDQTRRGPGSIGGKYDANDLVRFRVNDRTNVNINLRELSADANIELIRDKNQNQQVDPGEIIESSRKSGSSPESLSQILGEKPLDRGDYFVRVSSNSDAKTPYNLEISGTKLNGRIRADNAPAGIYRYDASGKTDEGIDPNKETIVVTHGWNGDDDSASIRELAKEASKSGAQVLAIDWSSLAKSFELRPDIAAGRITPVAEWAQERLVKLGIKPEKTTLIGHSFGSYVSAEIGRKFVESGAGKVKNLVALDPAVRFDLDERTGRRDLPKPFRDVASNSLAFIASNGAQGLGGIPGNNDQAATAHNSFVVRFPLGASLTGPHSRVVDTFTDALHQGFLKLPSLTLPNHQDNYYNDLGRSLTPIPGRAIRVPGFAHEGSISVNWTGKKDDWSERDRRHPRSTGNPVYIEGLTRVVDNSGREETTWT
nr:MAG: alpha/beta fold hydrolase [Leptolyngbya sp. IPPAS B-1204]